MKTKTLAGILIWAVASTALSAELKYTVRIEPRKSAAVADVDPMLAMLGNQILEAIVPDGPVEMTVVLGANVAKVEWNQPMPGIPAGVYMLQRTNGTRVMVNPATRTFWRVTMPNLYALNANRRPVVTRTPAEEAAPDTVAGLPATRSHLEIVIPFAEARAGEMVSGTPTELPLEGEVWVTDRFTQYATQRLRSILGLPLLGFDVAPAGHFVLRQVLRGPTFGNVELETLVTSIAEEDLPDSIFDVPPDYKEVQPPRVVGG